MKLSQLKIVSTFICACLVLVACNSANKQASSDSGAGNWAQKMQNMASNLHALMPLVFSRQEYNDPKNRDRIAALMKKFAQDVRVVPEHVGEDLLGKDPLVKYSLQRLRENSAQAVKAFQEGHGEYARNTLKDSMSTCFNCHTSNQLGPQNDVGAKDFAGGFRLFPTEKADYYVATRQYDKAIGVLEEVLKGAAQFYDDPHEQSQALKKYLALEVRVKKDPVRAASTIQTFLNNKKVPYYLAQDAKNWLVSLRKWAKEGQNVRFPKKKARELLTEATKSKSYEGYHSSLVEQLRATAILHESLRETQDAKDRAQTYYLLGRSYDVLADLGMWDLPEVYFEACIHTVPKTDLSKQCYRSMEKLIVLGYSGSAGIFIPADERKRLLELKAEAGL